MKHVLSELKEALSYLEPYKEQPGIMPHGAYWILKKQMEEIKGLIFAFPSENGPGMTLTQYAAIKLKVPRSGDPELDDWIHKRIRLDLAGQALSGGMFCVDDKAHATEFAKSAFEIADAMLAEWEKG
jgi:hypothetical protein